jgi:hypothetical protein
MKKNILLATLAALSIYGISSANAATVVVTFDDLATPTFGTGTMPATYAGLNWSCPSAGTSCMVPVNVANYSFNPSGY